jgi:hypothetical protein
MPFILITLLYSFLKNRSWKVRYPIIILSGWAIFLMFVIALNTYLVDYAPTAELKAKAISGDGAKNAFALFFGWIYALIFLLFLESIYKIISYIRYIVQNKHMI